MFVDVLFSFQRTSHHLVLATLLVYHVQLFLSNIFLFFFETFYRLIFFIIPDDFISLPRLSIAVNYFLFFNSYPSSQQPKPETLILRE